MAMAPAAPAAPALLRVLVTSTDVPDPVLKLLYCTKYEMTTIPATVSTREQVLQALPGQEAVLLTSHITVDNEFLDIAGPSLKVVSTMSAGYEHLDVPEIKRRGIKIGHTPEVLSAAVAEVAVFLLLGAMRRAHEGRIKLQNNERSTGPKWMLGQDLRGSTVGIVGLGGIGQAIVRRLKGFEVERFIYTGHGRKREADHELGTIFVTLDELLEGSDAIIISAPLTDETRGLFNDVAFNRMKNTAVLVNVSRGRIVDTESLLRALRDKKIFAAGLDVTDPDPLPSDHALLTLPNVEITPHLGSATVKTRDDMGRIAAQNIINGLENKPLVHFV